MNVIKIDVDSNVEVIPLKRDSRGLVNSSLVNAIGNNCQYIETVRMMLMLPFDAFLVVDEEGTLKENTQNMIASVLACQPIYGNAIIGGIEYVGAECDLGGFTDEQIDIIMKQLRDITMGVDADN